MKMGVGKSEYGKKKEGRLVEVRVKIGGGNSE